MAIQEQVVRVEPVVVETAAVQGETEQMEPPTQVAGRVLVSLLALVVPAS